MIIKGSSRAAPKQLAGHLKRADTNERVAVLELQWPAPDIGEAFRDWQTLSEGTRGSRGLYHANIDPAAAYAMTPMQWARSVEVLEEELGLQGQPRAVILHEKQGREHIHVVWARTDIDTMTLKSDSYSYDAHERASLRLEIEFGHEIVPGKHAKRDRAAQPEIPTSQINHAEWQQAERTGLDPRVRKEAIFRLYEASDSGPAFKAALEDAGYRLAQGDRRDFVLVDAQGEIHSLGRQLAGTRAAELRQFMEGVDLDRLLTATEARQQQLERDRYPPEPASAERAQIPAQGGEAQARAEALRAAIAARHIEEQAAQAAQHERAQAALLQEQRAALEREHERWAEEYIQRMRETRPQTALWDKIGQSLIEALSADAREKRIAADEQREVERRRAREAELSGLSGTLVEKQVKELSAFLDGQGLERAELARTQTDEMQRLLAQDQRRAEIEREYYRKRQEMLDRDREGPERDDRAR